MVAQTRLWKSGGSGTDEKGQPDNQANIFE